MKENLDEIITNIELIDNDNLKSKEIKRILKLIDSYEMEEYQLYYLKGYLWNLIPFNTKEREQNVESNLKKSIELNDNYIYSKTELSFFYYDQKFFYKVVNLLKGLDFSFFEEKRQIWKSLKLQELLLTSMLYCNKQVDETLRADFLGLIFSYLHLPDEELAIPLELVNGVLENKTKAGIVPILNQVNLLINSSKQKDYFEDYLRNKFESLVNAARK